MKNLLLLLLMLGCAAPKKEPPEPLMIAFEPRYGDTVESNPDGLGFIVTREDGTVEVYDESNQTQEDVDAAMERYIESLAEDAEDPSVKKHIEEVREQMEEWK